MAGDGGTPEANGDGSVGTGGSAGTSLQFHICDGQPGVRLAVRIAGGGPAFPGTAMLSENGWQFLLVEGSCVAWILKSENEPLRTMTLSREREQSLIASLMLSQWSMFEGRHEGGCADAPGINYRFNQQRISGPVCGLRPGDPLQALNDAFNAQLASLSAVASAHSGDIRYLLVPDSGFGGSGSRTPIPWPLDVPAASVVFAQNPAGQYNPGDSRLATGIDASRLRAIRTTALNGNAGNGTVFDFTPVVAADGVSYQLFARDAVPLENTNGLLPAEVF